MKQVNLKLTDEQLTKLDQIVQIAGTNRQQYIITMIDSEYDKIMGNPQLKGILEQMQSLAKMMNAMTGDIGEKSTLTLVRVSSLTRLDYTLKI